MFITKTTQDMPIDLYHGVQETTVVTANAWPRDELTGKYASEPPSPQKNHPSTGQCKK